MRTQRALPYAALFIGLLILALMGWTRSTPAAAQDNDEQPTAPVRHRTETASRLQITANGEYVYVLDGHNLYKLRANDLSLAGHKDLSRLMQRPADMEEQPVDQGNPDRDNPSKDSGDQGDQKDKGDNSDDNPPRR